MKYFVLELFLGPFPYIIITKFNSYESSIKPNVYAPFSYYVTTVENYNNIFEKFEDTK